MKNVFIMKSGSKLYLSRGGGFTSNLKGGLKTMQNQITTITCEVCKKEITNDQASTFTKTGIAHQVCK